MNKIIFAVALFAISACSTNSKLELVNDSNYNDETFKVSRVVVFDNTDYEMKKADKDPEIAPDKLMKDAILKVLKEQKFYDETGKVEITIDINKYLPGNAFDRWLMPYNGSTVLKVKANILEEKKVLAKISADREINAGGAFTIGAYESVFDDVAIEVVNKIKIDLLKIQNKTVQEK